MLDQLEVTGTHSFVSECSDRNGGFCAEVAKATLKQLRETEKALLKGNPNYLSLKKERDLGELYPMEAAGIRYDQLGHGCLCVLEHHPKWKAHALKHHLQEKSLARIGSWQAREWLGWDGAPAEIEIGFANRFFYGDVEMSNALCNAYGFK